MGAWAIAAPALASVAGSALSGYLSQSSSGLDFGEWLNRTKYGLSMQRESDIKSFKDKMSMADQFGIHPLAMLGSPGFNASPVNVGSQSKSQRYDFGDVGRTLQMAMMGNIEVNKARAKLLNAQADALKGTGQNIGGFQEYDLGSGKQLIDKNIMIKNPIQIRGHTGRGAYELGAMYMDKVGIDKDNMLTWELPQTAAESVESAWVSNWRRLWRDIGDHAKREAFHTFPWMPGAREHRNKLRLARDLIERAAKRAGIIPKNYVVQYNVNKAGFQAVPDDGKNYLYTSPGGLLFDSRRYKGYSLERR